jgi:hypothetical protein
MQNPIATTFDHLELVIAAFHKPTRVPVNKVMCDVVEPILSGGQKAIKATSLTRSYLLHPFLEWLLPCFLTHLRVKYCCSFTT